MVRVGLSICIILFVIRFPLHAQTLVIDNTIIPFQGQQFVYHYTNTQGFDPGASGVGQVWDFSALIDSANATEIYSDPATTNFTSSFPNSPLSLTINDSTFTYYQLPGNTWAVEGFGSDDYILSYTDPQTLFVFPFMFGDTFTDGYSGPYTYAGMDVSRTGHSHFEADGEGVVNTPAFSDSAVRVKYLDDFVDTFSILGSTVAVIHSTIINYYWISPVMNKILAIAKYQTVNDGSGTTTKISFKYFASQPTGIKNKEIAFGPDCYYDFSNKLISIRGLSTTKLTMLSLYSMNGSEIISFKEEGIISEAETLSIPCSIENPGIYVLSFIYGEKLFLKKLIIF